MSGEVHSECLVRYTLEAENSAMVAIVKCLWLISGWGAQQSHPSRYTCSITISKLPLSQLCLSPCLMRVCVCVCC